MDYNTFYLNAYSKLQIKTFVFSRNFIKRLDKMNEILNAIAAPVLGLVALKLGHMWGKDKARAETEQTKLSNVEKLFKIYDVSFSGLEKQLSSVSDNCADLSLQLAGMRKENEVLQKEIHGLRYENISLKKQIESLNNKLQIYSTTK